MRRRDWQASFALVVVGVFAVAAIVGPMIAPYDPGAIDLEHQFELPSARHWLGTADNGVDILSVLLHGARVGGLVALFVVSISLTLGTVLGTFAGLRGRAVDHLVSGALDLVQAFPAIVLNIAILALVARPSLLHLIVSLAATGWVLYARIARAQTLTVREREFVQAARALGMSDTRIVARHILPNVLGPLVVQATAGMGGAILAESTLSFLGLGPGVAVSWGALLDQGSAVLLRFPHVALIAGSTIALTVLSFNLAGDWLRDHLDVK